ncbi:uncharacterized protein FOBCDRAFT_247479 [Fusarium oxysporum Fo47]|uniref:uncharacterized protein n=1 Tax=Fusarium oxysporum Fo47 TaxID=660027 RepID=UPI002869DF85|nr:uncharacterized protein FOBCDRAFT_247479 [Fusarium oxysporum Fo47]WJG34586.1 hypothetical protein FOBCDRAFT_247479 [Fusarium oxysporum Fo47]
MIPANHPINSFGPGKPKRSSARKSRSGCMSFIDLSCSNSKKSKRYRCRHCQKDFAATSQAKQRQERQAQDSAGYLPSYSEAIQKKITEVGIQHISQDESHSYAYGAAAAVIAGGGPFSLFESRRWRYFFTRIKPG